MPSWEVDRGLQVKAKSVGSTRRHSGQDQKKKQQQQKHSLGPLLLKMQKSQEWVSCKYTALQYVQYVFPTHAEI